MLVSDGRPQAEFFPPERKLLSSPSDYRSMSTTTTDKNLFEALQREDLQIEAKIEMAETETEKIRLLRLFFLLEAASLRLRTLLGEQGTQESWSCRPPQGGRRLNEGGNPPPNSPRAGF